MLIVVSYYDQFLGFDNVLYEDVTVGWGLVTDEKDSLYYFLQLISWWLIQKSEKAKRLVCWIDFLGGYWRHGEDRVMLWRSL